ncbi:MAG: hypothetical protein Q4C49_07030 [Bacillota bacterium]|nr:hypothetical protein [Bacillota bacterium]
MTILSLFSYLFVGSISVFGILAFGRICKFEIDHSKTLHHNL